MWTILYPKGSLKTPTVLQAYNLLKKDWMKIYYQDELVLDYTPSDFCPCGRAYDDNPSRQDFKQKNTVFMDDSVENHKKILRMPELCMVCYYNNELEAGRWAPKYIVDRQYILDN